MSTGSRVSWVWAHAEGVDNVLDTARWFRVSMETGNCVMLGFQNEEREGPREALHPAMLRASWKGAAAL